MKIEITMNIAAHATRTAGRQDTGDESSSTGRGFDDQRRWHPAQCGVNAMPYAVDLPQPTIQMRR